MATSLPRYTREEFARRGDSIYERPIGSQLESGHKGEFVAIDVETGAYEVDADELAAADRLLLASPTRKSGCVASVRVTPAALAVARAVALAVMMANSRRADSYPVPIGAQLAHGKRRTEISFMHSPRFHLGPWVSAAILLSVGCGQSEMAETTHGLQEEAKVLKARIAELEAEVKVLKSEGPASKERAEAELGKIREELSRQHEDELARLRQFHEERVKKLQGDNAELHLQIGQLGKEKLALEELVDTLQVLPGAEKSRFAIERTVWGTLLLATLGVLVFTAGRCARLQGHLHRKVMTQAATMSGIGANG